MESELAPGYLQWLACGSKRRFETRDGAKRRMKAIKKKRDGRKKPQRVYECPHCDGFHLTSKPTQEDHGGTVQ